MTDTIMMTLVVPCFNEAKRFEAELFHEFLSEHANVHIIFVDDGSTDSTPAILAGFCDDHPGNSHRIVMEKNRGKAEAVRTGILSAFDLYQQTYIGYWDADLSTPLKESVAMISIFERFPQYQAVFASRVKLLGRIIERPLFRHIIGRVFMTIVSVMLQIPIYDSQCGAKLFKATDNVHSLFTEKFVSRWVFDVEIIFRMFALSHGNRESVRDSIYEYSLTQWIEKGNSKVRTKDIITSAVDLVQIYGFYSRGEK